MIGEYLGRVLVVFGLPHHLHPGPFRSQIETADTGEQRTDRQPGHRVEYLSMNQNQTRPAISNTTAATHSTMTMPARTSR